MSLKDRTLFEALIPCILIVNYFDVAFTFRAPHDESCTEKDVDPTSIPIVAGCRALIKGYHLYLFIFI